MSLSTGIELCVMLGVDSVFVDVSLSGIIGLLLRNERYFMNRLVSGLLSDVLIAHRLFRR